MTSRSRESRRAAARSRERGSGRNRWLLPAGAALVVVAAAVGAILLSGGDPGDPASTPRPTGSALASGDGGATPVVTGGALPEFTAPAGDPAVGQTIPTVTSPSASIALDGRSKVLLFLAHWCQHCQNEVPRVQSWLAAGGLPADVDLISVSTAIDSTFPNYPPEAWLEREGWSAPVIRDGTGVVADAFGLSAFPYWVFVNADGTVQGRLTGELETSDLETIVGSLRR